MLYYVCDGLYSHFNMPTQVKQPYQTVDRWVDGVSNRPQGILCACISDVRGLLASSYIILHMHYNTLLNAWKTPPAKYQIRSSFFFIDVK